MRKLLFAILLVLTAHQAHAQFSPSAKKLWGKPVPQPMAGNDGQALAWNNAMQQFVFSAIGGGSGCTLGGVTSGQLIYNNSGTCATAAWVNDTNVTASVATGTVTLGWSGTLAAARLNANVVQLITNDTNVTGTIASQRLTLGWTGTLAAGRLNSNVVQAITNDTNVTGTISAQNLTLGWTGTLAKGRTLSTTVYTDQANTYSTGLQDFSSATTKVPTSSGFTASATSMLGYDSAAGATNFHIYAGADKVLAPASGTITNGDCVQWSKTSSNLLLTDSGAGCGGGGGGTGNAAATVSTTFSATPTFTCPTSSAGTVVDFSLSTSLTANITSSTLSSCTSGAALNFHFVQDATGGRTVAAPTGFDSFVVDPRASAATDCFGWWDGSNWHGSCASKGTGYLLQQATEISSTNAACSSTAPSGKAAMGFDSTAHLPSYCENGGSWTQLVDTATTQTLTGKTSALASGTAAMGTSAIASGACATVVTVSATGVATTDTITVGFNGDPTAVTGYGASASGAVLTIYPYPTSGNVNFKVCNSTASSITPGSLTLNWRVMR